MGLSRGDIVRSLAGRDRGKLFYVVEADETYVTIADGKSRRLEKPKRKKQKHVQKVSHTDSRVAEKLLSGDKVLNSELRRDLAVFGQTCSGPDQGGS